jgi:hypothetical protein
MGLYKFEGGEVELIDKNILLINYNTEQLTTIRNVFNLKRLRQTLVGNEPYYTITDIRKGRIKFSDEAESFIIQENKSSTNRSGDAVLVNSLIKRIEVNLYILFNKPLVQTKIFTDLTKAIAWINTIK